MTPGARAAAAMLLGIAAAACSGSVHTAAPSAAGPAAHATPAESAVAVESSPPGDIPDTTQLVDYRSASGGYSLKYPEGWARRESGMSVEFSDNAHSIIVQLSAASSPPTPDSVKRNDEPKLRSSVRAFEEINVKSVTLIGGPAVLLRYRANSAPSDVTGKQIRIEIDRYEIYSSGRLAILSLQAPAGSDNVDVWKSVSSSFGWNA